MERAVQLRIGLAFVAASAVLLSQSPLLRPTSVSIWQMRANPIMWDFPPTEARAACVAGEWATDTAYRFYICLPDQQFPASGHTPYLWVRLLPDPSFLPEGYAPAAGDAAIVGALRPLNKPRWSHLARQHP